MFGREQLLTLLEQGDIPAVTISMPTHRSMPEAAQDPIRFKNLLGAAADKLARTDISAEDVDEMLNPGRALLDDADFWQNQTDGLGVFLRKGFIQAEHLPIEGREYVGVGKAFAIRPFGELFKPDCEFHLLAAAWEDVRVFRGDRHALSAVNTDELPESVKQIAAVSQFEGNIDHHSGGPVRAGGGTPAAKYHSLGLAPPEEREKMQESFAGDLARGMEDLLSGDKNRPLVLVADEVLSGMFAKQFSGDLLRSPETQKSPSGFTDDELHALAWSELSERRTASNDEALSTFLAHYQDADSDKASTNIEQIAMAAIMGRIDTLYFDPEASVQGTVDQQSGEIKKREETDLVDELARLTLRQGGDLLTVDREDLPNGSAAAALFRF